VAKNTKNGNDSDESTKKHAKLSQCLEEYPLDRMISSSPLSELAKRAASLYLVCIFIFCAGSQLYLVPFELK
jgi:hypothetical protein